MKNNKNIVFFFICISCIFYLPNASTAQEVDKENIFWLEDSLLTQRIDSLGSEKVVSAMRKDLGNAISFCNQKGAVIRQDSVNSWIRLVRWAVIMKDRESLDRIKLLYDSLSIGDKGQWQYYITNITSWGVFIDQTENYTKSQKLDLIISNMFDANEYTRNFYEERLIDLGPDAIQEVLDWAQLNLIPNMNELDIFMESEEDLKFTEQYDRFRMVFSMMFQSQEDKELLTDLQNSEDAYAERFVHDILEMIEF